MTVPMQAYEVHCYTCGWRTRSAVLANVEHSGRVHTWLKAGHVTSEAKEDGDWVR